MNRRTFNLLAGLTLTGIAGALKARDFQGFQARCNELEASLGGRLGVSCVNTGNGQLVGYRADERFPMCSTFKWLAVAAVLSRVDAGQEQLDRRIVFGRDEVLEWAPVTRHRAGAGGMNISELCEAAITDSDNTAANLLLTAIGGTAGWTKYLRSIGDSISRLDRREPLLNEALPGDVRDTTTPTAMVANLRHLLLGDALSTPSREKLIQWMLATKYSGQRLRFGLQQGWRLADKTGTGNSGTGTASDVGVYWPPSGAPIILAAYLTQARASRSAQDSAIATVGNWVRERQQRVS